MSTDFLARCEAEILDTATTFGFDRMTEDARTALADFLATEIELGGATASRAAHAAPDATWQDFRRRLRILGARAALDALARYDRLSRSLAAGFGEPEPEFGALTAEDLFPAGGTVLKVSGTSICEPPDNPG